jgi:hypothetical protein
MSKLDVRASQDDLLQLMSRLSKDRILCLKPAYPEKNYNAPSSLTTIMSRYNASHNCPTLASSSNFGLGASRRNRENSNCTVLKIYGFSAVSKALHTSRSGRILFLSHRHILTSQSTISPRSSAGRDCIVAEGWLEVIGMRGFLVCSGSIGAKGMRSGRCQGQRGLTLWTRLGRAYH